MYFWLLDYISISRLCPIREALVLEGGELHWVGAICVVMLCTLALSVGATCWTIVFIF